MTRLETAKVRLAKVEEAMAHAEKAVWLAETLASDARKVEDTAMVVLSAARDEVEAAEAEEARIRCTEALLR